MTTWRAGLRYSCESTTQHMEPKMTHHEPGATRIAAALELLSERTFEQMAQAILLNSEPGNPGCLCPKKPS